MIFTSGNETFFSVVFAVNCSKSPGWSGVCACKSSADVCVHVSLLPVGVGPLLSRQSLQLLEGNQADAI